MKKILIILLAPISCFCSSSHTDYIGDYTVMTSVSVNSFDSSLECGMVSIFWQINHEDYPVKRGITYIPLDPYMNTTMYENVQNPFFDRDPWHYEKYKDNDD